jgi:small-conductance mechanosensitive channel
MNAVHGQSGFSRPGSRPATAEIRRAVILQQQMNAAGLKAPSRFRMALRSAVAITVLLALITVVGFVGIALFVLTVGIVVGVAAAVAGMNLVNRLRGRPSRSADFWRHT